VICLKGGDPFLDRCLDGLATQDYPDARLAIVVDSETDEAHAVAVGVQTRHAAKRVDVLIRDRAYPHCSRKVSSLLTALARLPEETGIVAICDGDAVAHSTWLRELAEGLRNPELAAISGIRWYVPPDLGMPSLSRYYWNAMAVPSMARHGIIWGGSLALRASLCREEAFNDWLQNSFSEDTGIASYLQSTNRAYRALPSPLVMNTESITAAGYWNFLVRQMMCVRLDHPRWTPVLMHGLAIGLSIWVLSPLSWLGGATSALISASGIVLYAFTLLLVIAAFERTLRRTHAHRPAFQTPFGWKRGLLSVAGLIVTAAVYPAAIVVGGLTRSHTWRGVHYNVRGR
jgi:hypothetical protein